LVNSVTSTHEKKSPAVTPVTEFADEMTPEIPVVPLPQVTAPASAAVPLSHNGDHTT
jgi:hypothetical protein